MIRTLMAAAAVSGLLMTTAIAQSPGGANVQPITAQSPNQWLGSKLMGTDVIGPNGEKIGDVSDALIDKSGRIDALVVGVGGFLGIGAKDIALPMSAFQVVRANSEGNNTSSDQLRLSMTKEQLQQHAEFKALGEDRTTTGAGSDNRPRGEGSKQNPPASGSANPPAGGMAR